MFDRINKVIPQAFNNVTKAVRPDADEDVDFYDTLDESDLLNISKKYGPDNLVDYIESMEKRKLKGG